ncbi:MAG: hypothetical protein U0T79_13795 [Ferruginibacter sp.]
MVEVCVFFAMINPLHGGKKGNITDPHGQYGHCVLRYVLEAV